MNPIAALADRSVARTNRNNEALVREPHRARRMFLVDLVWFVVALAAMVLYGMDSLVPTWATMLLGLVVGWFVGRGVMARTFRSMTYRSGWLDGRMTMVSTLEESARRGISPDDWLASEYERDVAIMFGQSDPPP